MLASDDERQVLLLASVGGVVGGAAVPADHERRVAERLSVLHRREVGSGTAVPSVHDYYRLQIVPRIMERAAQGGEWLGDLVARVLARGDDLASTLGQRAMLHTDLYAENVLFEVDGSPVFIDPHPRVGPASFDWAFWCVYYVPQEGFERRLELCIRLGPEEQDAVVAWAATLALDGYLYYREAGDDTAEAMLGILRSPTVRAVLTGSE